MRIRTLVLQPILLYGISALVPSPRHRQPCQGQTMFSPSTFAADAHVGAEVLTVGVHHVHLAGFGAEYHQFLAEVVRTLHVTGGQVGGEGDDEPSRREPVLRQRDA